MFYTDTNGQEPKKRCLALVLLEAAMETRLPYELNLEAFNDLRADIERHVANLNWRFEE